MHFVVRKNKNKTEQHRQIRTNPHEPLQDIQIRIREMRLGEKKISMAKISHGQICEILKKHDGDKKFQIHVVETKIKRGKSGR
jgi:hypothetical protein